MIERLVALGADVNGLGQWGRTPLLEAARRGARDIVAFLISWGTDIRARTTYGMTALSAALRDENLEVARDLVLAGVEHDLVDLGAIGDSILVEKALKDGASVNEPNAGGERALCAAVRAEGLGSRHEKRGGSTCACAKSEFHNQVLSPRKAAKVTP